MRFRKPNEPEGNVEVPTPAQVAAMRRAGAAAVTGVPIDPRQLPPALAALVSRPEGVAELARMAQGGNGVPAFITAFFRQPRTNHPQN